MGLAYVGGWSDLIVNGFVDPTSPTSLLRAIPRSVGYLFTDVLVYWFIPVLVGTAILTPILATVWGIVDVHCNRPR